MTNRPILEFVERTKKVWKWFIWAAWLLGFLASSCAVVTICGYWGGIIEWQRWGPVGSTAMALNTAAAILALGVAVMLTATVILRTGQGGFSYTLNHRKPSERSR